MNVSVTQVSPILVKAEVSVPWENVADQYNAALKDVKKHASIPGFRKGKIPPAMLKKRYQPHILSELSRSVVPDSLEQAIKDQDIKAVGQPRILDINLKEKEALSFEVELDVMPEVTLKEYKGLEAERKIVEITDDKVDHELEHMLENAKKTEEITDRPAKDGETVEVAVTALDDETGDSLTDLDSYQLVMGEEGAHPDLSKIVADLKVEDDFAGVIDGSENDPFEAWRGKKVKLFLEVKKISVTHAPSLDDAFAKENDAENLDDLKAKTRARLEKDAADHEDARLEMSLINQIIEAYDFPVPDVVARNEAALMMEQQMMPYMQMMQGQPREQQRAFFESMMEYSMPQATSKVRADLVLEKIAEAEGVEISDEAIDKELDEFLPQSGHDSMESLKAEMVKKGTMESIINFLKRREAIKAVREAATITMVEKLKEEIEAEEAEARAKAEAEAKAAEEAQEAEASADANTEPEAAAVAAEEAEGK